MGRFGKASGICRTSKPGSTPGKTQERIVRLQPRRQACEQGEAPATVEGAGITLILWNKILRARVLQETSVVRLPP